MDRFAEMEAFVRVVEAGGFTEAARRAGISKSAISKQVSSLEQRLGARLLDRTTRRVSPNEIGLAYYDRAARALAEAEEADAAAISMQSAPQGELRLSAPHTFGLRVLSPIVADFLEAYPNVRVNMALDDRFVELIAEGFDLAIRVGALEDSALKARRLAETKMALVASPGYLAENGAPDKIDDLNDHALLHYSYRISGRSWRLVGPNGSERTIRGGGRFVVNNGEALLAAAERGLGVALLPEFIWAESLAAGRVVEVLPQTKHEPIGVWALAPPGPFTHPTVRAFIDFAADALKRARRADAG